MKRIHHADEKVEPEYVRGPIEKEIPDSEK